MLDAERVTKLAEAVADGQTPDWSSAAHLREDDQELIAELRAVASIGALFGTVSGSGPSRVAASARLTPGSTWGTLRVLEHVGAGRFGDVYRAWDPALDREVALKLMSGPALDDASDSQVVEEGRLMARVHHPNVVSVFGAQRIGQTTGLWMEFVEGRTLAEELADRGPFDAGDLVSVGLDLCRALQAVHEAGLVHRDVKTQNVMRDPRGRVVLGDFGVGRDLQDDEPAAGLAGTPAYIAPEIFARRAATPRSDLYSLGALLFHLATRRYPVEGRSLRSLRDAHENGARVSLAALRPDLPTRVTTVIDRALSVDPSARYGTADEMAAAFESTRASAPAGSTRRRQWIAAATLVIGLAAAAAFPWGRPAPPPAIPFDARDWVLVTAFDNRTGDTVLNGTLEFLLERELSNSSFVNVVPRARVVDTLRLMQRPDDTPMDPTIGREVALRDGQIRGVIAGRIDKVGMGYTMTASIMNPADEVVFASVSRSSSTQQGVLDAVGRLAVDLRKRLGEALPAMPAPASLPKVTTRSLRALQLYAQAVAMQTPEGTWAGRGPAAAQLLTQAIEADPEFASAHMLLSIAIRLQEQPQLLRALQHAERAVALSDDVSEVERLVNQAEFYGTSAFVKGTAFGESFSAKGAAEIASLRGQAIASYEAVLRLEPHHYQALICLVNLQQQGDRRDAGIAQRLADLRPQSPVWQMQAAWRLLADNRHADAMRYLERARAFPPIDTPSTFNSVVARLFDAYDAWMREDAAKAARIADRVAEDLVSVPERAVRDFAAPLFRVNLALGRLDRAERFAALNSDNARTIVALFREDRERLRATLAEYYPTVMDGTGVSSAFVAAGLLREARARLEVLKQQSPVTPRGIVGPPAGGVLNYLALVEGQILAAEGRADAAIAVLNEYLRHQPVGTTGDRWILATKTLARAWAAKSEFDRAIRLLEGVPWRIDLVAQSSNFNAEWLQVRDHLAQLYRKAGRDREGEAVDTQLLKLLAVADEDHPIRRRATARLTASTASAGSARPFHARDWVLVADTDNRTDAALDDAVRFALEQELAASSVVRVVSRPRIEDVLQLMRRPFDTRLAPAMAREVAVRDGDIRAVLIPRLAKVGAAFTLAVDIVRPADGTVVNSVTETSLARVDAADVSRIAHRVRERLGETIATIEPAREKLDAVATQSLRALQLYSRAWALAGEGPVFTNHAVVEQLLREALREDPEFVAAHVLLAHALRAQPEKRTEVIPQMQRAVAAAQKGRAEDRYLAEAEWHTLLAGLPGRSSEQIAHVNDAMASFEALLQLRPDHQYVLSNLLALSRRAGKPAKTRTVMAQRLVELRPHSVRALWDAALAHADAGEIAAARKYAARAGTLNVPVTESNAWPLVRARLFRAHDAWLRKDVHGAGRALDEIAAAVNALPAEAAPAFGSQLARAYESLGRLDAAEQMTEFQPEDTRRFSLLSVAMTRETPSAITAVLDARFERPYLGTGSALVAAGRLIEARRVLNDAGGPGEQSYTLLLAGQLALAEGATDDAITHLERLRRASLFVVPPHHWMLGTAKLAAAYAASGEVNTAIRTLENETRSRQLALEPLLWGNLWLSLREQLARLYRQVGRHHDATAVEQELIALLAVADEDHPIKQRLLRAR